ncbi:MAG TPA: hypothetical protein VHB51_01820 [Candidatus Saccharimonadales bacterium]|nr:hypothetical protein [Candidatus Saccharimonadales bacterium]
MSSGKPQIFASVETDPIVIERERAVLLGIGQSQEDTTKDVISQCQDICALGREACRLRMAMDQVDLRISAGSLSVKASCDECPNPNIALRAVDKIVDLADRRYAAVTDVYLGDKVEKEIDPSIFHLIKDEENGDYHVMNVESFEALDEGRKSIASRMLYLLTREYSGRPHQYARTIFTSDKLQKETGSRLHMFIVAEALESMVNAAEGGYRGFGSRQRDLLVKAHRLAVESGIAQEVAAEEDNRDIQIDACTFGEDNGRVKQHLLIRFRARNLGDLTRLSAKDLATVLSPDGLVAVRGTLYNHGLYLRGEEPTIENY